MSEQDGTRSTTTQRRSGKTSSANQQNGQQAPAAQRPANDDAEGWKAYWEEHGQSWRIEPEIDIERQKFLAQRLTIAPNIEQGTYPFKGIKLSRADVEWLLTTLEGGHGPVYWSSESTRPRQGLDLRGADLRQANLRRLPLAFARGGLFVDEWDNATVEQRDAAGVLMSEAILYGVHLERAVLRGAHLEGAELGGAHLEIASLRGAHLERSNLAFTHLQGTALLDANLSDESHIGPALADVHWGDINLAVVKWSQIEMLGDEYKARQKKVHGQIKDKVTRLEEFEQAVRANRQLAVVLRDQKLNEDAARFAYRAQVLQRKVYWYQGKFGQYLFSLFLDLLAGHGYKPVRSFIAYVIVISIFATIYLLLGNHLAWNEAIVISMTAFHGRGFFPDQFHPGDPQALVAALEAFVGLFIEVTFIATLTQRLFGK